ncbi:MAG: hypothetical protein IJU95_09450 [Treponema sp.]|nr:hypothetical protein [Treponema sp.]
MRIVVYSTNPSRFELADYQITSFPSRASDWESVAAMYPAHQFVLASQFPGSFLLDITADGIGKKAPSVEYVILRGTSPAALADEIASLAPDLAIAYSFWEPPFDWLSLNDSMIGERLRASGIRTVCNPSSTQHLCFDKAEFSRFLSAKGFAHAKSVHVKRELYWSERGSSAIESNVYKEYIFQELEKLHYPVVVKPAYGLSSYSMLKAVSPRQVIACLNSGKTKTDSLVEEYIDGIQAGAEIYGRAGAYTVLPPFLFSTDKWGITSPKQGIKLGPVTVESADGLPKNSQSGGVSDCVPASGLPGGSLASTALGLKESLAGLEKMLARLATELEVDGLAQVDLVFSDGEWHIIEVNPRLSGLSDTDAASTGVLPIHRLLNLALGNYGSPIYPARSRPVCNFKIPIMPQGDLERIAALPYIRAVRQLENKVARQKREVGYSEILIEGEGGFVDIIRHLEELEALFPGIVDKTFNAQLKEMAGLLG